MRETRSRITILLVLLISAWMPGGGRAQTYHATLTGTVTDATGGIIPGVTVTVTNVQTNQSVQALTDGHGL